MLVLTRRISQRIRIGDTIAITVLDVKGTQVRLGIAAPKTIDVDREEIHRRKQAELDSRRIPSKP